MASKRKGDDGTVVFDAGSRNLVEIVPLGAGQEVGRSCIILRYMYVYCGLVLRAFNYFVYVYSVRLGSIEPYVFQDVLCRSFRA